MLGGVLAGRACAAMAAPRRWLSASGVTPEDMARLVRFATIDGVGHFGIFTDDGQQQGQLIHKDEAGGLHRGDIVDIATVLPPVDPPAVFCVGLNYKRHAEEVGMDLPERPVIFMKAPSSLLGHGSTVVIPTIAQDPPEVDFEAELGVVIGRECYGVPAEEALDYVLGYTIANDVSARRWQGLKGGGQWSLAKSFDSFCPCGPYLVPRKFVSDPQALSISLTLNGEVMQESNTSDMVFSVAEIVSYLSQGMTLQPGTLILTGTPEGVGYTRKPPVYLKRGDWMEVSIEGLGTLSNGVGEANEQGMVML